MSSKEINVRADLKKILALLEKLKKAKKLDYKVIDTAEMSDSQRSKAYIDVIGPSVFNKYEIRRVFGTNRQSGVSFGKEQPALYVAGDIWDVFPHRKNGKVTTIESFLEHLMKSLGVE